MNRRVLVSLFIAAWVLVAILIYISPIDPVSSPVNKVSTKTNPSVVNKQTEESAIKEILIEYVHAMLLDSPVNPESLFTNEFINGTQSGKPLIPTVSSAQIGQPIISFLAGDRARVRFEQITRSGSSLRHTHERMMLKRMAIKGWRIDKRASQPVMVSSTLAEAKFPDSSFLYVKNEKEKAQDIRAINKLIQYWTDARTEADMEAIMSVYQEEIWRKKGITKEQWFEDFRSSKKVTTSNINILFPIQTKAEVVLNENIEDLYKNAHYDVHLTLQLSDNGWLIADEKSKTISETIVALFAKPESTETAETITSQNIFQADTIKKDIHINTTPISEPSKAGTPAETVAVSNLVSAWRKAWMTQNIDAYLAFYSENFKPKSGMDIARWRQYRRTRLGKPKSIDVQIRELRVLINDKINATATFIQEYKSDVYQDTTKKLLSLVRESGAWKIVGESATPL